MGESPLAGGGQFGDFTILYLAARVLKAAGFDAASAARALNEVYGAEVEPSRVEEWFSTVPRDITERPVLCHLVQTLSSEKLWALKYVAGAALGDADCYGELRVTDLSFAQAYANALAVLLDDPGAAIVRVGKDGYHTRGCRPLMCLFKSGLWRILAYLDKLDEKKYFLSGLMDAEGTISPHRVGKSLVRFQVMFTNTNRELTEFVKASLEDLGLNPRIRVHYGRRSVVNGKVATYKRPIYMLHAEASLAKIEALAHHISIHCERKRKLIEFLISVKDLPPRTRYEELKLHWRKWRGRWWPANDLPPGATPDEEQPSQHNGARKYTVRCPECLQWGTLTLQRDGKIALIHVIHSNGSCELDSLEADEKSVRCKKCGKPGRLCIATDRDARRKRCYRYVKIRVEHRTEGKTRRWCHLMRLPLQEVKPGQAGAEQSAEAEQASPNPHHRATSS